MASIMNTKCRLATQRSAFLPQTPISSVERNLVSFNSRVPLIRKFSFHECMHSSSATSIMAAVSDGAQRAAPSAEKAVKFRVRAIVTIRRKNKEGLKDIIGKHLDALYDKMGKNVLLQIVSTKIDQNTRSAKRSDEAILKNWLQKSSVTAEKVEYACDFVVASDLGEPGAIAVVNHHQRNFFLESIVLEGFMGGPIYFTCNSWIQSAKVHQEKRIFFSNRAYLPSDTPEGLKALREKELKELRGDGSGCRKLTDRVYDYDVYNDLGNPDEGTEFERQTMGGEAVPYPRRCRTGRPAADSDRADGSCETRIEKPNPMYVPCDEAFGEAKRETIAKWRFRGMMHSLIPSLKATISKDCHDFKGFGEIEWLYREAVSGKFGLRDAIWKKLPLTKPVKKTEESSEGLLRYDTPSILSKDKFAWLRDDEFARQMLAGVNPVNIERLKAFPPISKLDPNLYGPSESAIKEQHIIGQLDGMTVQQALGENKLFMLDYHDMYMPFLDRINAMDGRKAYATRTLFFLTLDGTLKPIAIELSLPPAVVRSHSKRVITPASDATSYWLWQLAKAHVCSNDAGAHQLINHWLRTHACIEPFVLAAHRQMSSMHPIMKLLHPHMRYTLEINAMARQSLINAGGVIESCFTPGPYSMEMSAVAYDKMWRFDQEGLPADLLRRGVAVVDPSQPHRLRLLIEDYPYAADGLLIWSAIETWVNHYVSYYYPDPATVQSDVELQSWYTEAIHVGHREKRHEKWWPELNTVDHLASILTTLIWLTSAQHAALNFGQYAYNGYVPNRPPLMRRLVPREGDPEYRSFVDSPGKYFLQCIPSVRQATKFMAVVDTLSTHSPDEEYLGERPHQWTWTADLDLIEAYYKFSAEIQKIERVIQHRNSNPALRNRCGAGVLPYELMMPSSEPGVTGRGIPNSVTI